MRQSLLVRRTGKPHDVQRVRGGALRQRRRCEAQQDRGRQPVRKPYSNHELHTPALPGPVEGARYVAGQATSCSCHSTCVWSFITHKSRATMNWQSHLAEFWPQLVAGFSLLASLLASIHALLNKRDSRAAALWLGFIWLLPFVGPLLYLALGINRIRRHALSLRIGREAGDASPKPIPDDLGEPHRVEAQHLRMLAHVV